MSNTQRSNKLPYINWLRNEVATHWPVVFVCCLLCLVDLLSRVMVNGDEPRVPSTSEKVTVASMPQPLDVGLYTTYINKLTAYNDNLTQASPVETVEPPSYDRQDDSVDWYTTQYSYRLMAIFHAQERFAVLKRTHNDTGITDLINARAGDSLGGFLVGELTIHGLEVKHSDGDIVQLRLFEPLAANDDGSSPDL
jgi:hypothetical protein